MKNFLSICFFVFFSNVCFGQNQLWITAEFDCNVSEYANSNKSLGTLNANDSAKVLSYGRRWWKVAFNGKIGYLPYQPTTYQIELKSAVLQKEKDDSLKAEIEKKQKEDELTQKGIPLIIYNLSLTNLEPYDEFLDFEVDWKYINDKKVVKYIYFTVVPYNRVGDIVTHETTRNHYYLESEWKVTGPIESGEGSSIQCETSWYRDDNAITCIELTKVKVVYMDGSQYTYINDLPNILDSDFKNSCRYIRKESDKLDSQNQLWITAEYNCDVRENLNPNSKLLGTLNANDSAKVLSYSSSWWKVAFNGKIGYLPYQPTTYQIELKSAVLQKEKDEEKQKIEKQYDELTQKGIPLIIYSVSVLERYHKDAVDFKVDWKYINDKKVVKYIYFTVVPYNSVGDIQTCRISGDSEFTGKVTGPIERGYNGWPGSVERWPFPWWNNTITCIELTKVKVVYMDGSQYTYINELPKILDSDFKNSCKYN